MLSKDLGYFTQKMFKPKGTMEMYGDKQAVIGRG